MTQVTCTGTTECQERNGWKEESSYNSKNSQSADVTWHGSS